jgi:1-acyl-sn-glycerol-3-phosphate acyltransferase
VLSTGVAFAIFGLSSLVLALTLAPWIRLTSASREICERRTQRLIQRGFRFFIRILEELGLASIHISGGERLAAPGSLVVANHPTLLDVVALIACMPQADCIVKQAHFERFFMRGMLKGAGYLPNTGGQGLIDACAERLRAGRCLVIFFEGTRSPRGSLGPFHRGVAHIALTAGCDLLPVVITCDPPTLMKGQHWYDVPDRPFDLRIQVGEPFSTQEFIGGGNRARSSRMLTASLRAEFEKRLERARS